MADFTTTWKRSGFWQAGLAAKLYRDQSLIRNIEQMAALHRGDLAANCTFHQLACSAPISIVTIAASRTMRGRSAGSRPGVVVGPTDSKKVGRSEQALWTLCALSPGDRETACEQGLVDHGDK